MTTPKTVVTWVDAREGLPESGMPVAAATTGRYPPDHLTEPADTVGEEFWLVRPMVFMAEYQSEDGREHTDCFVDSDEIVRLPYGLDDDEPVTHWSYLPTLPGRATHVVLGEDVQPALRDAWGTRPPT